MIHEANRKTRKNVFMFFIRTDPSLRISITLLRLSFAEYSILLREIGGKEIFVTSRAYIFSFQICLKHDINKKRKILI